MANQEQEQQEKKKIRWRKIGGGSFRLASGKIVKPNEVFYADPEDIPERFRDCVRPLEDLPVKPEIEAVKPEYTVKSVGPGIYNVLDAQGKVVNEKPLKQKDAKDLVESLS